MMRIACVLAEGFEDSELKKPYDEFKKAGHGVTIIGAEKGKTLAGKAGKEKAKVDLAIADAEPEAFDALLIPGGHSPDQLRADDRFVQFTRAFADKPIFAICHGPQLLITAEMVRGKEMTAWKTIQVDLRCAGAHVMDEEVVVDGNLVTSRQPSDIPAFVQRSLELMQGGAEAHAAH
jgi:protease I